MDTNLPPVVAECDHDLHDRSCRKQASEGMGDWVAEPSPVAAVDCCKRGVGSVADELGSLGCIRKKPSEMEQVIFAEAIWRAFAQCFLTHDEAIQAIDDYGRGLLHNAEVTSRPPLGD